MCYYVTFGLMSAGLAGVTYYLLYVNTTWNPYLIWIVVLTLTTFLMYGLDKLLSKTGTGQVRAPELILHALSALGGFIGGWLGVWAFDHKSNFQKHPWIWVGLILSTLFHAWLTYVWFIK